MTAHWAYLGPEGTFTEQAARDLLSRDAGPAELVPCAGVSAALTALREGRVDAAIVPLENSVEGSVPLTHDELIHGEPLVIVGEAFVPVTFDLLVRPGTELSQVRTVGSHPHGHAQVRDWLATGLPHAEIVTTLSTAEAAAEVAAGRLDAAAAAPVAGARYGLVALARDIGLERDAVTRFVALQRPGPPPPPTGNDRSSFVLSVENRPGALLDVLTEITGRGVNMVRLESRPTRYRMGEYVFLVDVDSHLAVPSVREMVAALIRRSALLRWLGSYPRALGTNVPVPDFASSASYEAAAQQVSDLLGEYPA
ncbi:prephenate dehydratase [Nakamurella sp. YIM 132087]|uniref:Prephenate dehydratase n=1 Tax=Nakamurella alba TaxID=2665158 RepID=A0A7K1FNF5_9ACTN|nr:prephenate dehydratase [Nakamurella alba]MTD15610.1 prephenate dehydratase [Nakamurella alba]